MTKFKEMAMRLAAQTLNLTAGAPFSIFYGGIGHILMFHRVQREVSSNRIWANSYLEVTTQYLEEVVRYFQRHGYVFVSMDEVADCIRTNKKFVVFTFDDGFKDNLEFAYPVLARHKVPMTVFVSTGFPGHTAILWWNEVERLLLQRTQLDLTMGDHKRSFDLSTPLHKQSAFRCIADHLRNSVEGTMQDRIAQLYSQFGIDPLASVKELALSWDDLITFSRLPNVLIGAHTVSHPVLSRLDEDACQREVSEGKRILETALGRSVEHFAYPFGGPGDISKREAAIAERAGFKTATTTYSSNVQRAHADFLFQLPRIAVGMSMTPHTFDLIRHGVIPMVRNRGRRIVKID